MRTRETPLGTFTSGSDYRDELMIYGYTDWGWMNGWKGEIHEKWNHKVREYTVEDIQWNNRGSDCTYVCHALKIFSSVDMGD